MKTTLPIWASAALTIVVPAWLLTAPVSAQHQQQGQERGQSGGGGGGGGGRATPHSGQAPSGGGGGSSAPATGGGGQSSGGGGSSFGGGSSSRGESGGSRRDGATGGSGYAMPRGGGARTSDGGARTSGGGGESGTASTGGASSAPAGERARGVRDAPRDGVRSGNNGDDGGVPAYARPREGRPVVGTAAPRGSVPPATGSGGGIYVPGGYYPGYGYGYGYGGYYGAGYGYYDPFGNYGGFGGFYGGYYDPWYGGYPADPQGGGSYTYNGDDGKLRLKLKPRDAEVYVDGYYAGVVDDFDGIFQRLHLDSGPHRIEVRATGYEPLTFEVRITPEHTTTYEGELKRIQ